MNPKSLIVLLVFILLGCSHFSKITNEPEFKDEYYKHSFVELDKMLDGSIPIDFKRAVFLTENAYLNDSLSYPNYLSQIDTIVKKIKWLIKSKKIEDYKTCRQYAVYSYLCEPTIINDSATYKYDFKDFIGNENWTNMFVTKLMKTKKGNCHSLPLFFKILAEEIGAEVYLSLAPSHIYIKHRDESGKWVNIELTNGGSFPSDAWIISSLGISSESIQSGAYMAPLSIKESVAQCLYDLAMGYKQKYGYSEVVEKMCDKVIEYYPNCLIAHLLKYDCIVSKRNEVLNSKNYSDTLLVSVENKYKELYKKIIALGYSDMSPEFYEKWARSADEEMKKTQLSNNKNGEQK